MTQSNLNQAGLEAAAKAITRAIFDSSGQTDRDVNEPTSEWYRDNPNNEQVSWQLNMTHAKAAIAAYLECVWLPISEAPKDGTPILTETGIVRYCNIMNEWNHCDSAGSLFKCVSFRYWEAAPKYWQHLPTPPTTGDSR